MLKFHKNNWTDIWFLEKLGTDCISFYETVNSLLKTIGNSLEKKITTKWNWAFFDSEFFIKKNWELKVNNKIKEQHNTSLRPIHNSNMGFNPKA
jgi:hypothetical protein